MLSLAAQGQDTNLVRQIEELQEQLRKTQENFTRLLKEQQEAIEALRRQAGLPAQPGGGEADALTDKRAADTARTAEVDPAKRKWLTGDALRFQKGQAYLDVGLVGTVAVGGSTAKDIEHGTQLGGHDPQQNGFTLQNLEAAFYGAVDPYFRAYSTVLFGIDSGGESVVELEEAYLETLALPGRLQLRAGQFLTDFGRHNPTHPHTWASVDTPLVSGRFFGHDGLRGLGARLSWLAPTPFYSELSLAVQNSHGETAHSFRSDHEGEPVFGRLHQVQRTRGVGDLLFAPRYVMAFDLSDTQTLMLGASAALGKNASGDKTSTQIGGLDLYWKWKPRRQFGGFPFVSWQSEVMARRYEAGRFDWDLDGDGLLSPGGEEADLDGDGFPDVLPDERLTDYGLYSQVCWGFRKGWVAGLRGDYVASRASQYEAMFGRDPHRAERWRLSPSLTWYPSEYSKIRFQYNFDERKGIGPDHSIWLQLEFVLGAHAAHKF